MSKRKARTLPLITVEWLTARVVEDEHGCLIWQGYYAGSVPMTNLGDGPVSVRRLAWKLGHDGREPRCPTNGWGISCAADCSAGCVHPLHVRETSKSQRHTGKRQAPAVVAKRMARARATSKIPDSAIDDLRAGRITDADAVAQWGITRQYAHMLRAGQWRKSALFGRLGATR